MWHSECVCGVRLGGCRTRRTGLDHDRWLVLAERQSAGGHDHGHGRDCRCGYDCGCGLAQCLLEQHRNTLVYVRHWGQADHSHAYRFCVHENENENEIVIVIVIANENEI